jgi:hypothetical protein
MSPESRSTSRCLWIRLVRASRFATVLFFLAGLASAGCGDSGGSSLGQSCSVGVDGGAFQPVFTNQAPECPGAICLKPADQTSSTNAVDTSAYCSATCSSDSDCNGQKRDNSNANDKRCENGYACGVAFVVGTLCCKKLCLCKDFLSTDPQTPAPCDPALNNGQTACLETQ